MKSAGLATIASVIGAAVGALTIYWRMEAEMEEEITRRVRVETRLATVEQQAKQNKDDLWTLKLQLQQQGP